jgi:transcriptional regulator with XRE-family HTH domain
MTKIAPVNQKKFDRAVLSMQATVAKNLTDYREQSSLTQQQLSELAGIDRKTINRIENGHFSPSIDTLTRLAVALNVLISDFFEN